MNAEDLRYKMKHLDELLPDRSVTNQMQFFELYNKFVELIEDTEYDIDIVDMYSALHCAMEDYEMYA